MWNWIKSLFIKQKKIIEVKCAMHLRFMKSCPACKKVVANG